MAALAAPAPSLNQFMGTWLSKFEPYFQGGELQGCSLIYKVAQRDFVYRRGEVIILHGNVSFMKASNNFAVSLKVIINELNLDTGVLTPSSPTSAYLISGANTTKDAVRDKFPSDLPGGLVVVFDAEKTFPLLLDGLSGEGLTISYAYGEDRADATVVIDTSVEEIKPDGSPVRSNRTREKFFSCVDSLLKREPK